MSPAPASATATSTTTTRSSSPTARWAARAGRCSRRCCAAARSASSRARSWCKPGAQKTDGYQISQGLLLDETSQFLAKPELEIYADDVKCSHGSTVGAVDETALFYLTSRGMPRRTAEELLVLAFVDEAIAEIEDAALADDMRDRLAGWLARRRG